MGPESLHFLCVNAGGLGLTCQGTGVQKFSPIVLRQGPYFPPPPPKSPSFSLSSSSSPTFLSLVLGMEPRASHMLSALPWAAPTSPLFLLIGALAHPHRHQLLPLLPPSSQVRFSGRSFSTLIQPAWLEDGDSPPKSAHGSFSPPWVGRY
jgi:hypothetical protein